jgi:hypothetical protein
MKCWFTWQGYVDVCLGNALTGLHQAQIYCSFDGCPAVINIEFTKDTLGVCADCTQGDHEFMGDLRPRKLTFEQSENFKLALAQRFNEGL